MAAYVNWYSGVSEYPLNIVASPPNVMKTLFIYNGFIPFTELNMPQAIRATVFDMPMADTMYNAVFSSMPPNFARSATNKNGMKKPIMVRKPLSASIIKEGDFRSVKSNMVANVRRTASGHTLQLLCSSYI